MSKALGNRFAWQPRKEIMRTFGLFASFGWWLIGIGFFGMPVWAASPDKKTSTDAVSSQKPVELSGVEVRQQLGQSINLERIFQDHQGKFRPLRDFFRDGRPVILTLNYYNCPMLCTMQLNGLVFGLKHSDASLLQKARIVTVSINPKETAALAAKKRAAYLKSLAPQQIEWTFMVGKDTDIRSLAKSLGFGYKYIPRNQQYAHPAVIFVLTPNGKISKYLNLSTYRQKIAYTPNDLKFALIEASEGKVGSYLDQLIMSCFMYDDSSGKYTTFAFGLVRLGGVLTLIVLALFLATMWIRERQRKEVENAT